MRWLPSQRRLRFNLSSIKVEFKRIMPIFNLNDVFIAYDALGKIKAPKALADALGWIESAILEFGVAGLSLRALIECLKTALKNSNAAVRTSATKTLVTVKLFAGAGCYFSFFFARCLSKNTLDRY
jgi:hypothetical protein